MSYGDQRQTPSLDWLSLQSFLFVLLFCCLIVTPVFAQEQSKGAESSTAQLYKSSGLQELIVQIPSSTASAFEATLTNGGLPRVFDNVETDAIKGAVRRAFITDTFDKHLTREIDRTMSEDSIEVMLHWYSTSLGSRVRQAELDNSLLNEQSRFESFQTQLAVAGVDSEREQLIFRLDETMQSTESAVDMMASIQVAFNMSLSRFLPEEQRLSSAEIQSMAKQNHSRMMTRYRNQTREVLLFTYQDFDNDELQQMNDTLASVAGQEFVAAINDGIKKGMFAASLDLGDGLGALIGSGVYGSGI